VGARWLSRGQKGAVQRARLAIAMTSVAARLCKDNAELDKELCQKIESY